MQRISRMQLSAKAWNKGYVMTSQFQSKPDWLLCEEDGGEGLGRVASSSVDLLASLLGEPENKTDNELSIKKMQIWALKRNLRLLHRDNRRRL